MMKSHEMTLVSLFSFLPEEILGRCPQSLRLPMYPYEVFHTDRFAALPASPAFAMFVRESYAREAWQCFFFTNSKGKRRRIPGCYDDYADSFMLRQLALQACEHIAE